MAAFIAFFLPGGGRQRQKATKPGKAPMRLLTVELKCKSSGVLATLWQHYGGDTVAMLWQRSLGGFV